MTHLSVAESAASPRSLRRWDYLTLNVYWFALAYLWNSLGPIILPVLVPRLVPDAVKGSALGLLTSVGLIVALVVQPAAGAVSDRARFRWGRRRPFVFAGTLFDLVFLFGIATAGGYPALFIGYLMLQLSSNIAHGPYQGLIPDLVPEDRRGAVSGVKQLLEVLGIILTSLIIGRLVGSEQMDLAIASIMILLLGTMLITVFGVREEPGCPLKGRFFQWVVPAHPTSPPNPPILGGTHDRPGCRGAEEQRSMSATAGGLRRGLQLLFHSADFFWWLVSRLFILLGINLVRNFALFYVGDVLKLPNPPAAVGDLLAVLAVAVLFVVYPAGYLSDRVGRKPLIIASGLLGAVGAALLMFARTYLDLLAYGGLLGVSIGVFLAVNWAWATDLVPAEDAGRYLGISNLATAGAGVFAGLGGPLLDFFNARQPGLGYPVLYGVAALCYLLGTMIAGLVRETRPRNAP